jgi:hypothetical protein
MGYTHCKLHYKTKLVFGCKECIKARGKLHAPLVGEIHNLKRKLETLNVENEESIMNFLDEIEKFIGSLEYEI